MFQQQERVPVSGTLLFVPGDRPDRIRKALAGEADIVAVDLEDAVDPAHKERARDLVVETLTEVGRRECGPAITVRVNAAGTEWTSGDLAAVEQLADVLDGVLVPKAEDVEAVEAVPGDLPVVAIVESARGVFAAGDLAAHPRVHAVLFGSFDLAADLGVTPSVEGRELLHARSQVALACAAAGLPGPIDGPHPSIDDLDGLAAGAAAARELGFTGKVVLHPKQIDTVRAAFAPTQAQIEQAQRVLAAYHDAGGAGAIRLSDGTFVDRPVLLRAVRILGLDPAEVLE
ncbi:citrate lyase beta subunit [Prauserella sp. Am3]|nr:citrate lyase beta subunit [Prauserella sp. Am3]